MIRRPFFCFLLMIMVVCGLNAQSQDTIWHQVGSGECLSTIASKYGVTYKDIKKWNNLTSDKIVIGMSLMVVIQSHAIQPNEKQVSESGNTVDTSSPPQKKRNLKEGNVTPLWIIVILLSVAIILLIAKNRKTSGKIRYLEEEIKKSSKEVNTITEKGRKSQSKNAKVVPNDDSKKSSYNTKETHLQTQEQIDNRKYLYYDKHKGNKYYALSINNERFVIINDNHTEDAIFELSVNDDDEVASVTICKSAYSRVLADPGAYLRGCDKNVWGNTQVNIIEKGTARKTEDGKWMVEKKLKVELI